MQKHTSPLTLEDSQVMCLVFTGWWYYYMDNNSLIFKRKCGTVFLSNPKDLFSSEKKKNDSLLSERVFPHFSEDPFSVFIDLLHTITVKLLPDDLFLMNSTWLKKEAQCGITVSHQLPITHLLTVHGLLCNNWSESDLCRVFWCFPSCMFLSDWYFI